MEFWAIIDGFEDYQVSTWHKSAIDRRTTALLGFNYAE